MMTCSHIFHFLISEATSNWSNASLRTALARAYDHGVMKTASNRILNGKDFPGQQIVQAYLVSLLVKCV
jgi:hypothetical protein